MLFAESTTLWIALVTALVLWLPQNAQHEYAHVAAHRHWGAFTWTFTPYPSWKLGYFTWAHMTYLQDPERPLSDMARGACAIAPQALNTVVLSVLLGIY